MIVQERALTVLCALVVGALPLALPAQRVNQVPSPLAAAHQQNAQIVLQLQQVHGFVSDNQGYALEGATVTLIRVDNSNNTRKSLATTTTKRDGSYSFAPIAPGYVVVKVEMRGFKTFFSDPAVWGGLNVPLQPEQPAGTTVAGSGSTPASVSRQQGGRLLNDVISVSGIRLLIVAVIVLLVGVVVLSNVRRRGRTRY